MPFDSRLMSGLAVLVAVVESGGFARAAEALALTPSGVSRAVGRLEQRMGTRLFDRGAHAVTLTDEGRRLYERVLPLLTDLEDATVDTAAAAAAVRGRLRINVDPLFARLVLAPHLAAFMAAHPELAVDVSARWQMGDLVAEGFDVAARFGEPEPSALVARRLLETRVLTCAAPAYLARRGTPRRPEDLGDGKHECIHFRDPVTRRPFQWELSRAGETVKVAARGRLVLDDVATMVQVCAAGQGVAQILELGAEELLGGGLVQLLPDWAQERFPLYAYYPSRRLMPAKVRAFIDFVVAVTGG